jgi:GDPmannose 4,6-dehydratase
MENILITGITGQDGIFLTHKLIKQNKNFSIIGISRQKDSLPFYNKLKLLGTNDFSKIKILHTDLTNKQAVDLLIKEVSPTRVFNLSGPSSVYESLNNPANTDKLITGIFDNLTESLITHKNFCNFFQASSSEMLSGGPDGIIDENSEEKPNSPYAISKLNNHKKVLKLSDEFSWNMVSGIMFNHESEFRDSNYLTPKIISGVNDINNNKLEFLDIGSIDYMRDWCFAGDVMDAAIKLSFGNAKGSYIIGSGNGHTIQEILEIVFGSYNLNWKKYVSIDKNLLRKGDPKIKIANPKKIYDEFGWEAETSFFDLIMRCMNKSIQ